MPTQKKKATTKKAINNAEVSLNAESVQSTTDEMQVSASRVTIVEGGSSMKDKLVPFLVIAIVVASFVVGNLYGKVTVYEKGGVVQGAGSDQPTGQAQAPAQPGAAAPAALTTEQWEQVTNTDTAAYSEGNLDSKVILVEFTDYECPFCARYFTETYGALIEKYVDTDQIGYITRDLPLSFHANAKPASLAARCAGDQDAYRGMHDMLFENQQEWAGGDARESFVQYASDLGLNTSDFESCYDGGKYNEAIDADLALASSVGANGTPTFFINGERIVGAQPTSAFETAIDAALEN